jgi:hypothetical protein
MRKRGHYRTGLMRLKEGRLGARTCLETTEFKLAISTADVPVSRLPEKIVANWVP